MQIFIKEGFMSVNCYTASLLLGFLLAGLGCREADSNSSLSRVSQENNTLRKFEPINQTFHSSDQNTLEYEKADGVLWGFLQEDDGGLSRKFPFEIVAELPIFEGDIILDSVEVNEGLNEATMLGVGLFRKGRIWPEGKAGLVVDESCVVAGFAEKIMAAAAIWEDATSVIQFDDQTPGKDYIRAACYTPEQMNGAGGSSYIGRKGGEQLLKLSTATSLRTVIHEFGHALGLAHEHSRSDRGDFVKIDLSNISLSHVFNFLIPGVLGGFSNFSPYDYDSIMHYSAFAFAKDPAKPTILAINADGAINEQVTLKIGRQTMPSTNDVNTILKMYSER